LNQPTVVVTQWIHQSVIDLLAPHAQLILNQSGETLPPAEVRARCAVADAMIAFMSDRIDDDFLADCPHLRIVAAALKGWDNIDRDACTRFGVWLSIVPDLLTVPTAELAIGLTLGLGRHIRRGDELMRRGDFSGWRPILYGIGLAGTRVGVVGLGAVEFFLDPEGRLLVNEMAPRPHNSGHYSIDACATRQVEQHIRAIAGLPFGATDLLRPVVMTNLLGDLWSGGTSDWAELLADPRTHLHLYDKGEPRPGRKMGHFTVLDDEPAEALRVAEAAFAKLEGRSGFPGG